MPRLNRNVAIAGSVALIHVAALWALQSGLLRHSAELVVPIQILAEIVTPPAIKAQPTPAPPPPKAAAQPATRKPAARKIEREPQPAPRPADIPDSTPASNAPAGVLEAQPPAPPLASAPPAAPQPGPASAPPAEVQLPSSQASYLGNPAPVYPNISKRLGEQGRVVVRVLIGADGTPQEAQLKQSSGFDRLDQSALAYVMRCRFVPGKVGGVPQAMWYDAPVTFVLQ